MSKAKVQEVVVSAGDVIKMLELLEALITINKNRAQILRSAKRLCPRLIGENVKILTDIHKEEEDELDILTDLVMELKKVFLGDASIIRKGAEIISDIPRRIQ